MNSNKKQTYWLVGASTGIGYFLCKRLLEDGHQVIASSREAQMESSLKELKKTFEGQLVCLNIDVSNSETLPKICHQAWQCFQGIDCWIYNVGTYTPMTLRDWQWQNFLSMTHTNYLGAVAIMLAIKPFFLQQGHGHWVWNISLASDFGLPYSGGYSAPKAALLNLAESIQPELKQSNIDLQIINHGFVKTRLTAKNDFPMLGLMEADTAAQKIYQAIHSTGRFEIRFPWNLSFLLALLKRLPKRWSLALTRKMLK